MLDLSALVGPRGGLPAGPLQSPHRMWTTSGRAAIHHALRLLPPGFRTTVLVPSYHCPTMVAPILAAGFEPDFVPIDEQGHPRLETVDRTRASRAAAAIIPQLFGLPRSLAAERHWCDRHGVFLIEDCAHSLFGSAGDRPAGHWGDYAIASLTKFLPIPEGGLLTSCRHRLPPRCDRAQGVTAEIRGLADMMEISTSHGFLPFLWPLFALKRAARRGRANTVATAPPPTAASSATDLFETCDMARIDLAPLVVTRALARATCRERIAERRRSNYALFRQRLAELPFGRCIAPPPAPDAVPYVFPFWVNDADGLYAQLRSEGYAVFRWDRVWPGSERLPGDAAPHWRRHVLQLLCHQQLGTQDIERTINRIRALQRCTPTPDGLTHTVGGSC